MAGDVVMGICYVCHKEVTDEDFSRVGYQMYKNVVHGGDCFNTFKKQVQEHKTKKKTDQLYDIADEIKGLRKDLRELIEIVKPKEINIEGSFEWDPEHLKQVAEEHQERIKPIQALIDAKALELYKKSKGAGENV